MGMTTVFEGCFMVDRPLDQETFELLRGLENTRRMKRNVPEVYGIEGEFYIDGKGFMGQDDEPNVIDTNTPPITQPDLWVNWHVLEDKMTIEWNRREKFYHSYDWIVYIVERILEPRGYTLNGAVNAMTEYNETYHIDVTENKCKLARRYTKKAGKPDFEAWVEEDLKKWS
jgi:hypothetical protein